MNFNTDMIVIDELPFNITKSGYYYLSGNLTFEQEAKPAISIVATADVIIDGQNHFLKLTSTFSIAFLAESFENLHIINLSILYQERNQFNTSFFLRGAGLYLTNLYFFNSTAIYFEDIRTLYLEDVLVICRNNQKCTEVFLKKSSRILTAGFKIIGGYLDCVDNSMMECYALLIESKNQGFPIRWRRP